MFWKTAGMKSTAMATGVWEELLLSGMAFPAGEALFAPGKAELGSGGALQPVGNCQTPLWPCNSPVSAPLSAGLKARGSCTLQLLLAINSRQELPGSKHLWSQHLHNKTWVTQIVGEDDSDFSGLLLLHKDMLEHCGSPWGTLSTLSSHRCAPSAHSTVPCQHSPHVCAGWHLGSCSSSCHQSTAHTWGMFKSLALKGLPHSLNRGTRL